MEKKFIAPELKLAGEAGEITLGSGGGGGDYFGEFQIPGHEFIDDNIPSNGN